MEGGAGGAGGISPFTLCWTLGMLRGYSVNLVSAGSHAETGRSREGVVGV